MHKLLLYKSAAYPLPFRKHVPLMLSHTLRTCSGRRMCVYCIHEYPPPRTHINSPGTSVFPHNNCEMSVNLQTLLYFYCCIGTPVNAACSGPACFSVHWPFICLHSPPFLWCISPLMYVWKCVGVCLCLCTNTYVWVSHLCYGTVYFSPRLLNTAWVYCLFTFFTYNTSKHWARHNPFYITLYCIQTAPTHNCPNLGIGKPYSCPKASLRGHKMTQKIGIHKPHCISTITFFLFCCWAFATAHCVEQGFSQVPTMQCKHSALGWK